MPYLNLELNYFEHVKTIRLIGILGKGAELLPIKLWAYCARVHPASGWFKGYSDSEIENIAGWDGESGAMVAAMLAVRLLEGEKNHRNLHQWKSHEGHLVAFHERAKNAAKRRWDKAKSKDATSNALSNAKSVSKQCSYHTIPTIPNQPILPEPKESAAGPRKEFREYMDWALRTLYGLEPGNPDPNKRAAVSAGYRRYGRAAKDVLAFAEGNPQRAIEGTEAVGRWLQNQGMSWTIDTVAKWVPDYFRDPMKFTRDNGNNRK